MKGNVFTKRIVALAILCVTLVTSIPVYANTEKGISSSGMHVFTESDHALEYAVPCEGNSKLDHPESADAAYGVSISTFNDQEEAAFVTLNNFRVNAGKQPLSVYDELQQASSIRVWQIAVELLGGSPSNWGEWYEVLDQNAIEYEYAYEIYGYGYETMGEFMAAVLASPEDVEILKDDRLAHIGISMDTSGGIKFYELLLIGSCKPITMWERTVSMYTGAYGVTYGHAIKEHQFYMWVNCPHASNAECMIYDEMLTGYNPKKWNTMQEVIVNYNGLSVTLPFYVEKPMNYIDVTKSDWYYDSVEYLYYKNIMAGLSDIVFGRDFAVTRGQFATFLYRLQGSPSYTSNNTFTDVPANAYYAEAVGWANSVGIVSGFSPEIFGPDSYITREQMTFIMYRYANYLGFDTDARADLEGFEDVSSVSPYAEASISWAVAEGIISGMTPTTLAPQNTAYRVECAAIIQRFMQKIMQMD